MIRPFYSCFHVWYLHGSCVIENKQFENQWKPLFARRQVILDDDDETQAMLHCRCQPCLCHIDVRYVKNTAEQ